MCVLLRPRDRARMEKTVAKTAAARKAESAPKVHHKLIQSRGSVIPRLSCEDDILFTTQELADLTRMSTQFFDIGRVKGWGPPFIRIGTRIRYRRDDVVAWLNSLSRNPAA